MTFRASVSARAISALLLIASVNVSCTPRVADVATALKPAATVDSVAISQSSVVAAVPADDQNRRQAQLDAFVGEQLFANTAVRDKLDTDANVLSGLESARRQVLARAYVAKKAAALPKPTRDEINAFYQAHSELFARRRIYRLQEIAVAAPPERAAEIVAHLHGLKTFNDHVDWLKKAGIPFTTDVVTKAAEDIAADLLSALVGLKDGDAIDVPNEKGFSVLQVTGIQNQPLTLAEAQPLIERSLNNQRLGELINQESQRLRASAKIEYFPPYSAKKR